jgi:hypothetical protein
MSASYVLVIMPLPNLLRHVSPPAAEAARQNPDGADGGGLLIHALREVELSENGGIKDDVFGSGGGLTCVVALLATI